MDNLGTYISSKRHLTGLTKLGLSTLCNIDQGLISKYESGKRSPSEKHLNRLSEALSVPLSELRLEYLADKIAVLLQYENNPNDVLEAAETRLEYLISERSSNLNSLSDSVQKKLDIIDNLQAKWSEAKPLSGVQLHKMKEYFNVQYTFDSNRIEGNTLTLKETHLVINEGLTIGGKSLHHHLEAINHLEAIHWVYELIAGQRDVNKRSLLELHQLILKSIDSEHAGRFRQLPVRISGSAHIPPQPFLIDKLMEDFIGHYERQKRCLHPVILAAEMHERLVSIHPFIDGHCHRKWFQSIRTTCRPYP